MKPLQVCLVDDEPLARARLRRLLSHEQGIEIVAEFDSGRALLDAPAAPRCDVLLIDVEMPELDGFATLERIANPRPQVIFVTAFSEHALRAFDIAASDYLVKPVAPERLRVALDRARAQSLRPSTSFPTRMAVPSGRGTQWIEVERIDCVRAQANYVEFQIGARRWLLRRSLAAVTRELDPARFVRVQRSLLVRIDAVVRSEPDDSGRVRLVLASGETLRSGRQYRAAVRAAFGV